MKVDRFYIGRVANGWRVGLYAKKDPTLIDEYVFTDTRELIEWFSFYLNDEVEIESE